MLTIVRCTEHVIKSKAAKWFECNHCDQYNAVSMTFRFVWIQFKFHASPKLIQKCNPVSASVIRSCPDLHIELTVYCIFIAAVGSTVRNNWLSTKKFILHCYCSELFFSLKRPSEYWPSVTGHCICVNWALTSSLKTINAALNPLNKGIFLFSSWFTQVIIIRLVVYRQLIKDTSEAKEKGALGEKRSRYIDSLYSKFWFLIPYENISVVLNLDIKWFVMLFYW